MAGPSIAEDLRRMWLRIEEFFGLATDGASVSGTPSAQTFFRGDRTWANAPALALSQFSGADRTGTTSSTAAFDTASARAKVLGLPLMIDGIFRLSTQPATTPTGVVYRGGGYTSDASVSGRAPSVLLKDYNGQGIVLGDDSGLESLQVDCTAGKTGDNVQLAGTRSYCRFVSSTNSGRDAFRVGTDATPGNSNDWALHHCIGISAVRHAVFVTDTSGSTDANGGTILGGDYRNCGGDAIKLDNCEWVTVVGPVCQTCTGYGGRITANARSVSWYGGDIEGNTAGQGILEAASFGHYVVGPFYAGAPVWVDNGGAGTNTVIQWDASSGTMGQGKEINLINPAAGGVAAINMYADTGQANVASFRATQSVGSGGKLAIRTKRDGNTPVDRMTVNEVGLTQFLYANADTLVILTYSASMTPDAAAGNKVQITATDGAAFTINAPTTPTTGQSLAFTIRNTSGGALGAVTWNAVFKLAAWVSPATGNSRSITFLYDGSNWREETRTPADVPN